MDSTRYGRHLNTSLLLQLAQRIGGRGGSPLDAPVTHALRLESFVVVGFQLPLTHVTVWPEKFRRRQSCVAGGWSTLPPHMTAGRKFRRQGMCHGVDGAWAELGLPKK